MVRTQSHHTIYINLLPEAVFDIHEPVLDSLAAAAAAAASMGFVHCDQESVDWEAAMLEFATWNAIKLDKFKPQYRIININQSQDNI